MEGAPKWVDVVFTCLPGGPDDPPAVFVELEDDERRATDRGEWLQRDDGYWVLRIPILEDSLGGARRAHADDVRCVS